MNTEKNRSWLETFFEISSSLDFLLSSPIDDRNTAIDRANDSGGRGEILDLMIEWTNEFEEINKDREWDGEFYEEVDEFMNNKNKIL